MYVQRSRFCDFEDANMVMPHAAPVLLGLLFAELSAFLAWVFRQSRQGGAASHLLGLRDDLLWPSLVLASTALGAFFVYLLLI
jgi:hypothetical protein